MNGIKRWMLMMAVMHQVAGYAQLSIGNPKEKFSLSATVDGVADSDYTWDTLPRKALYDLISERVGLFANWQASQELSLELGTGVNIPFYGRVRDISHPHIYMKLHADAKPYVQLKLNYSIKRN